MQEAYNGDTVEMHSKHYSSNTVLASSRSTAKTSVLLLRSSSATPLRGFLGAGPLRGLLAGVPL